MPPQTTTGSGDPGQSSSSSSPATGGTSAAPPQPVSGTWVQADDPQILIQWTLNPPTAANSGYTAQVGVYQLIFDTVLPTPTAQSSTVPFSLTDPAYGPHPYLQGTFTLTQNPPALAVANLEFPEFPAQTVPLVSLPATPPAGGTSAGGSTGAA
jgi:hypothetical protein